MNETSHSFSGGVCTPPLPPSPLQLVEITERFVCPYQRGIVSVRSSGCHSETVDLVLSHVPLLICRSARVLVGCQLVLNGVYGSFRRRQHNWKGELRVVWLADRCLLDIYLSPEIKG